ncbi:MAG: hypothetical protein ACRDKI_01625 [Solirubrobacterales bacterium]
MAPDPERLGGLAWARRTGGELTPRERRRLLGEIVRGQAGYLAGRIKLATGRVPKAAEAIAFTDFQPPDSALVREAEQACLEQSDGIAGHGRRTWIFGSGLAALDGETLEPEQFYVASLLHDHGIEYPAANEDFVIRSADRVARCAHDAGAPGDVAETIGDAISIHSLPGVSIATDGVLGFYVQAGAMYDLAGLRAQDLTKAFRDQALAAFPRAGVTSQITELVRAEAKLNPRGRFALLKQCGMPLLFRLAPLKPR